MPAVALAAKPFFRPTACSHKKKMKIQKRRKQLDDAVKHAMNICLNFEDTVECRVAWDQVDDMHKGAYRARQREQQRLLDEQAEDLWWEYMSEREYDV